MSLTAAIVGETESGEHVEATARCTVDVSWWLCDRHAICAHSCGFSPRIIGEYLPMSDDEVRELKRLVERTRS